MSQDGPFHHPSIVSHNTIQLLDRTPLPQQQKCIYYNIVVFGESGVGKSAFLDQAIWGVVNQHYDPTGPHDAHKRLRVDDTVYDLDLLDLNASILRDPDPQLVKSFFENALGAADGIVLLYSICSRASYEHLKKEGYINVLQARAAKRTKHDNPYPCGVARFGCILVGTHLDRSKDREVDFAEAQEFAQTQDVPFFEISTLENTAAVNKCLCILTQCIAKEQKREEESMAREEAAKMKEAKQASSMASRLRKFRTKT